MSSQQRRQPRKRRTPEEARAAILDAAEAIVQDVGPAGLRIAAVAKAAKMAHPNVLHHFGSREGLLNALTTRTLKRAADRVVRVVGEMLIDRDEEDIGEPGDALARVLDAALPNAEGRGMAWLVLSGRAGEYELPDLEPLVQLFQSIRVSQMGPVEVESTRRLIALAICALLGNAVIGAHVGEKLRLAPSDSAQRDFKQWLAEFLVAQTLAPPGDDDKS